MSDKATREWQRLDQEWAARQIAAIDTSDPERAHDQADQIMLVNSHPAVAAAYNDLMERCAWWASA